VPKCTGKRRGKNQAHFTLVKIDVEGFENRVLAGMRNLLRQNKCVVQIKAFEPKPLEAMHDLGYRLTRDFLPN